MIELDDTQRNPSWVRMRSWRCRSRLRVLHRPSSRSRSTAILAALGPGHCPCR
jgi:hypothetical protein